MDGYYKSAREQLDDGLFGQTLILSAFNYAKGEVYGVEFTASYNHGGFSTYANVAVSRAQGEDWNSAQFLFDPADPAYVQNHWISLDHDQRVTGSFGASYTWKEGSAMQHARLCGRALRQRSAHRRHRARRLKHSQRRDRSGLLLGQCRRGTKLQAQRNRCLKARLDVVNVTDNSYELRDGSGVGVNAAQYGARLGFFGSMSYVF